MVKYVAWKILVDNGELWRYEVNDDVVDIELLWRPCKDVYIVMVILICCCVFRHFLCVLDE